MAVAKKPAGTRVFVAKESFSFSDANGNPVLVVKGNRYREGHPHLDGREANFKLDDTVIEVP